MRRPNKRKPGTHPLHCDEPLIEQAVDGRRERDPIGDRIWPLIADGPDGGGIE